MSLDHIGRQFKAYCEHNNCYFNADEFLLGGIDCRKGLPHREVSESYTRGYSAQYELQEVLSARTNKSA